MEKITILQLNLNKCEVAQANLIVDLTYMKTPYIALIQEPHFTRKQQPSSINQKYMQCFFGPSTNTHWPRAMIVASKTLNLSKVSQLTSRDTTTINLHNKEEEIFIVSSYQDIKFNEVVNNLKECLDRATQQKKPILLGIDSNAHSQLWNCDTTNHRGKTFEETIASNSLFVCNVGKQNTYCSAIGKSIIDITLVSSTLVERILEWKVNGKNTLSDHKLITFSLTIEKQKTAKARNYGLVDWNIFKIKLVKQSRQKGPIRWSTTTIENEANCFIEQITNVLDQICPLKTPSKKQERKNWWNAELQAMKTKMDTNYNTWKKFVANPTASTSTREQARKEFVTAKHDYTKMVKSAKRNAWNKLISENVDIYSLDKIIHRRSQNNISLLEGCTTAKESLAVLLDNYFPNSKRVPRELTQEEPYVNKYVSNKELADISFITPIKAKEAFQDMEPLNASGPDGLKAVVFQQLPDTMLNRLCQLYKACIKLNYTPSKWCHANVIFLPKTNKDSYDKPSSFRPISKFGIALKGLEKLVKWEVERTSLKCRPLFKDQHAYSRVKNAETAILRTIDEAEKGLLRNQFTLGVFLDLKGAFNNLDTTAALKTLKKGG